MPVIAIANKKGGVGKTTISANLAGGFAKLQKSVLLIDMDSQGNLSQTFLSDIHALSPTIDDLLIDGPAIKTEAAIRTTRFKNIDIIPANSKLDKLTARTANEMYAQDYLTEALNSVRADGRKIRASYDFIVIDCPPRLEMATRMALVAADRILIPLQPQSYSVTGYGEIAGFVEQIQKKANPALGILGIVINGIKRDVPDELEYANLIRQSFKDLVFATDFLDHVKYERVPTYHEPTTHRYPESKEAKACLSLANEIFSRLN